MSDAPFSFEELSQAQPAGEAELVSIPAADGVVLACRRYLPPEPLAVLLFCHGGGAHGGAGYGHLGQGLADHFGVATYLPDARGHGLSGGARGDAPGPEACWADLDAVVRTARNSNPGIRVFLGGHSSGAGLVLNYMTWEGRSETSIAGLVFLAPHFGYRSETLRADNGHPFATAKAWPFILNALSGGRLAGHSEAVSFHYPADVLSRNPLLLRGLTVNAANALTPSNPARQFSSLDCPIAVWIGAKDEVLDPERVTAFVQGNKPSHSDARAEVVPLTNHLSILLHSHQQIGEWLSARQKG